jgi:hypothetical protein
VALRSEDPAPVASGASDRARERPVPRDEGAPVDDQDAAPLEEQLEQLGFRVSGESRRGGRMWALAYNRFLRFALHDYASGGDDRLLLSWSFAWGEYVQERGWQLSLTDASTAELYPTTDVVVPPDASAVRGEVLRVLSTLRLDLGAPEL